MQAAKEPRWRGAGSQGLSAWHAEGLPWAATGGGAELGKEPGGRQVAVQALDMCSQWGCLHLPSPEKQHLCLLFPHLPPGPCSIRKQLFCAPTSPCLSLRRTLRLSMEMRQIFHIPLCPVMLKTYVTASSKCCRLGWRSVTGSVTPGA